jgi:RND family efflux transporter MFP subunit
VDPQTGTISMWAVFPNAASWLKPGQFARLRMSNEIRVHAVLVPRRAVSETLTSKNVLVLEKDRKVSLRIITIEGEFENFYIVSSGLQGGEQVVMAGLQKVRPGMVVAPAVAGAGE